MKLWNTRAPITNRRNAIFAVPKTWSRRGHLATVTRAGKKCRDNKQE